MPVKSRLTALAIGLLLATMVASLLSFVGVRHRFDWPATSVLHGGGHMYVVPLPQLPSLTDTNETPQRSPLRVHENRRKLGPPHSQHVDIIAQGGGRFSHFDNHIYFAASDNTDVRTNGRAYWATYYWKLNPLVPALFGALTAFLLFRVVPWSAVARSLVRILGRLKRALRTPRPGRLAVLRAAAFACTAAAAFTALLAWGGIERRMVLDNTRATGAGGKMFAYELKAFEWSADSAGDPLRSDLALYEGTRRLGPAHSPHADIADKGAGRYSHYSQVLYFSSSDNSDVTQNGRRYSIVSSLRVSTAAPVFFGVAALGCLLALALAIKAASIQPAARGFLADALRRSGSGVLLAALIAVLAVQFVVVLYVSPDVAANELDLFRRALRRVVSLVLAVGAGVLLAARWTAPAPDGRVKAVAGTFIFLAALGTIVSDRPTGFPVAVALIAVLAWFVERRASSRAAQALARAKAAFAAQAASAPRKWVWLIAGASALLTLINVLPEVVRYWDQSGWMDSHFYDVIAHDIARGATPFGHGEYAPVYQFSMAGLYWMFGHLFFMQQIANLLLACTTALAMCWAAWFFFERLAPVVLVGLLVGYLDVVHHAVYYTQIENLYVPLFALSILALGCYLKRQDWRATLFLALAATLVFATRQQGAFYVAALPLAILLARGVPLKVRLRQIVLFATVVVALGVLPWSLRNWHVEGRFSPSSAQASALLAILNDPRIPFHAIRYWERSTEVRNEWIERYPNVAERHKAMQDYFRRRLVQEPEYFFGAAPWRLGAFYGLLPGAYFAADWTETKPISMDSDWIPHLKSRFDLWGPVLLSLVALAWRWRSSTAWLIVVLVGGNVAVGLLVGSAEPRGCYPVLLLHFVLGLALLQPFARQAAGDAPLVAPQAERAGRRLPLAILAILVVAIGFRVTLGAKYEYREVPRTQWLLRQNVQIDRSLPLVSGAGGQITVDGGRVPLQPGKRYRAAFVVTAYMFPPRFTQGLPGLDPGLASRDSVQYYFAKLAPGVEFALRFDGAEVAAPLKEHDLIEAEFTVDAVTRLVWLAIDTPWASLEKAVVTGDARSP